ncbi:diphthamide synthesis protein [Candidatus Woesearchaeota archaeon]|nr:diphthamide synthesis protein [Candidatus Woesearchaeota archaeon]
MRAVFIEVKAKVKEQDFLLPKKELDKLPKSVCFATTVQFKAGIGAVKKQLEDSGRACVLFEGRHTKHPGQMLGCDVDKDTEIPAECFLYMGDGMFHPNALLFNTTKDVFLYNPVTKDFKKADRSLLQRVINRRKAAYKKYLAADNIGIMVTVKPGQQHLKKAMMMKERLSEKGKNVYVFVCDNVDFNELENFPFVEVWINTACPRIAYEDYLKFAKPVLNMEDIFDDMKF